MIEHDIEYAPMDSSTIEWVEELLSTCRMFGIDYYKANEKERVFAEEVARKNYMLKQARANRISFEVITPFMKIKRAVNAAYD